MVIKNGAIISCTKDELHNYWLEHGFDTVMPFDEYMKGRVNCGTVVTNV